jgi:hypothetical protein
MTGMIPAAASNEVRDASNEVLVNGAVKKRIIFELFARNDTSHKANDRCTVSQNPEPDPKKPSPFTKPQKRYWNANYLCFFSMHVCISTTNLLT